MRALNTWSEFILDLYREAQNQDVFEFHEYAIARCKTVIPFDSALIAGGIVTNGVCSNITSAHLHNQPIEKMIDKVGLSSPDPVLYDAWHNPGQTVTQIIAEVESKELRDYAARYSVAQVMAQVRREADNLRTDIIAFWRADADAIYTSHEVEISNVLLSHVLEAHMINLRLYTTDLVKEQLSRPVVVNARGEIQFIEQTTVELLQCEWPEWKPPILPNNFMERLHDRDLQFHGRTLKAETRSRDHLLYIYFKKRHPAEQSLTPAELAVAELAVKGLSYKDIARHLEKSPATVRNQLHNVYAKLGASSKDDLAIALDN